MNKKFKFDPIQHLFPYLQHKVECIYKDCLSGRKINAILTSISYDDNSLETTYKRKRNGCYGDIISFNGNNDIHDLEFKLKLHPLLKLTKKIEHDGEKFIPMARICSLLMISKYEDETYEKIWYGIVNGYDKLTIQDSKKLLDFLYQHHFDVLEIFNNGLIENGKAIEK